MTQPTATLITEVLTLIGAGIAFWAVNRQINANGEAVTDQINASVARQKRSERIDFVTEAAHLVDRLASIATRHAAFGGDPEWLGEPSADAQRRVKNEFDQLTVWLMIRKLDMLGLPEASEALKELYHEVYRIVHPTGFEDDGGEWTVYGKQEKRSTNYAACQRVAVGQGALVLGLDTTGVDGEPLEIVGSKASHLWPDLAHIRGVGVAAGC